MQPAVTFNDIKAAQARLKGVAIRTPLLENAALNEAVGGRVLLKAETLQHVGAFKFRGAYNRLVQLSETERKKGVVAWSSGNHAQGIAAAAKLLGMPATIIMPKDSPQIKVGNTRAYGAEIHFYDRYTESREEIGQRMAAEQGATLVPSYDDPHIIAGQGTVGLEVMEDAASLGLSLDALLVPISGGGLCAGCSIAVKATSPQTQVYTVEPSAFDDTARSLKSGKQEKIIEGGRSICDALQAPYPGDMTFPIMKDLVTSGISVTDVEVKAAVRFAWEKLKLVVEPSGAVALAAMLFRHHKGQGKTTAIILSGGNIDPDLFQDCLNSKM